MTDISKTIEPRSDQLNADDMLCGKKIIEITGVKVVSGDQPVHINYVGGEGKPYKPCLSMRRVLIKAWGKDGDQFVGRKLELFNDPTVKWAGQELGGIRISAMSHIDEPFSMMLTVTRGKKSLYSVGKLETEEKRKLTTDSLNAIQAALEGAGSMADLQGIKKKIDAGNYDAEGTAKTDALYKAAVERVRNA